MHSTVSGRQRTLKKGGEVGPDLNPKTHDAANPHKCYCWYTRRDADAAQERAESRQEASHLIEAASSPAATASTVQTRMVSSTLPPPTPPSRRNAPRSLHRLLISQDLPNRRPQIEEPPLLASAATESQAPGKGPGKGCGSSTRTRSQRSKGGRGVRSCCRQRVPRSCCQPSQPASQPHAAQHAQDAPFSCQAHMPTSVGLNVR